jgi:hypothetical protein
MLPDARIYEGTETPTIEICLEMDSYCEVKGLAEPRTSVLVK